MVSLNMTRGMPMLRYGRTYSIAFAVHRPFEPPIVVVSLSSRYAGEFSQIAIGTDDVYKTAEVVKLSGGQVVREAGPLPGLGTKITAILDPDGWKSVSPCRHHVDLRTIDCSPFRTQLFVYLPCRCLLTTLTLPKNWSNHVQL